MVYPSLSFMSSNNHQGLSKVMGGGVWMHGGGGWSPSDSVMDCKALYYDINDAWEELSSHSRPMMTPASGFQ